MSLGKKIIWKEMSEVKRGTVPPYVEYRTLLVACLRWPSSVVGNLNGRLTLTRDCER